jgi:hypothetical protein
MILRVTLLAALALAGVAPAATEARSLLDPPVATVIREDCPWLEGGGACAVAEMATVWVPARFNRRARLHEFGHLFDAQLLTAGDRDRLVPLLGHRRGAPWKSAQPYDDSPEERFADAYSLCRVGLPRHGADVTYGYLPSRRRHQRVCNMISFVALIRAQ